MEKTIAGGGAGTGELEDLKDYVLVNEKINIDSKTFIPAQYKHVDVTNQ
jgi:hypothetical protein